MAQAKAKKKRKSKTLPIVIGIIVGIIVAFFIASVLTTGSPTGIIAKMQIKAKNDSSQWAKEAKAEKFEKTHSTQKIVNGKKVTISFETDEAVSEYYSGEVTTSYHNQDYDKRVNVAVKVATSLSNQQQIEDSTNAAPYTVGNFQGYYYTTDNGEAVIDVLSDNGTEVIVESTVKINKFGIKEEDK